MLRVWGKVVSRGKTVRSSESSSADPGTGRLERIKTCVGQIVRDLDLPNPIWLPVHEKDMLRFGKTRFTQDSFIETFPYNALEIEIIEDDEDKKS